MVVDVLSRALVVLTCTWVALVSAPGGALAQPASAGEADDFITYEVVEGDTCIGIARKVYEDGKLCYDLIAVWNEFDEEFRIYPGQTLRLPTRAQLEARRERGELRRPDAQLEHRRGDVSARPPEEERWLRARPGQGLWRRWRVNSGQRSSAQLWFLRERARLEMRENTLVVIYGPTAERASTGRHAVLERGALTARLGELSGGARATVETPSAVTSSGGGDSLIHLLEGDTTLVSNYSGEGVEVTGRTPSKKTVAVPRGMGTRVERGESPTKPRPLPEAPAWVQDQVRGVTAPGVTPPALAWEGVEGAVAWRVEVRRPADGAIVDAIALEAKTRRIAFEGLEPGRYEVRASSIDGAGFESEPSEPAALVLHAVQIEAPAGRPADAEGVLVGTRLRFEEGVRCRLGADGELASELVMRAPGRVELSCQEEAGALEPVVLRVLPLRGVLKAPGEPVAVQQPVRLQIEVEPPVRQVSVEVPEGFEVVAPPRWLDESGGRWELEVVAIAPGASGPVVVRTAGAEGVELARAEIASAPAADRQVAVEAPARGEPAPAGWRFPLTLAPIVGARGLLGESLQLGGQGALEPGWRVGARVGLDLSDHWLAELELDYAALRPAGDEAGDRTRESLGWRLAGAYVFGTWAVRPLVRLGVGTETAFDPAVTASAAHAGLGVRWDLGGQIQVRADAQEYVLVRGGSAQWVSYMGVSIGAMFGAPEAP